MAGQQAVEYFSSLPVGAIEGMQEAQPLQEGSNEAEWIVDITTQADRQGRRAPAALLHLHTLASCPHLQMQALSAVPVAHARADVSRHILRGAATGTGLSLLIMLLPALAV